jgi:hypothetical protein
VEYRARHIPWRVNYNSQHFLLKALKYFYIWVTSQTDKICYIFLSAVDFTCHAITNLEVYAISMTPRCIIACSTDTTRLTSSGSLLNTVDQAPFNFYKSF